MSKRTTIVLVCWIAALGVAVVLDRPVAEWVSEQGWDRRPFGLKNWHWFIDLIKLPGEYLVTAVAAVLLAIFYRRRKPGDANRWQAAGLVAASGAMSGINSLLKWVIGRRRPVAEINPYNIDLFIGGMAGFLGAEKNLSFPSGHAAMAFANASALALLLPRWRWLFYAFAALTGVERIAENSHYVSDTVAGAAVGCLATWGVVQIFRWITRARSDQEPGDLGLKSASPANPAP